MGVVANFAQQVFSGIRDIGIQIWNGIRNDGEVIGNTVVGFVNGIQTLIRRILLVQITSFVLLLALFTPEILLLPLLFISYLILFGKIFLWQDHLCDNNNEENQNIQILGDNNQNLNEEPRERDIDLTNVFLVNTESYINDIRNNPGYEQITRFLYTFTLENDDIVVRQQNQSESDSELNDEEPNVVRQQNQSGEDTKFAYDFWEKMNEEDEILQKDEEFARKLQKEEDKKSRMLMKNKEKKIKNESESDSESELNKIVPNVVRQQNQSESDSELNNRVSNVLLSYVTYEVINNNENTLISLSFANEIEDIELGRRILRRIKDQLNRNYPNQVRVVETLDDPIEVEIEQIEDIDTILMVITI